MTDLAADLLAGDRRALARAVSIVEDHRTGAEELLAGVASARRGVAVIGITGPPGAGKSTLTNAIVTELRGRGLTVAVAAVDPSSPLSGGAVLGDRVRMLGHIDDPGVYVRSLASRGRVGGLAWSIVPVVDVLDAAGFDVVIVETVGAGQSEVDIAGIADTTVVVVAPGAGDDIQAMKAGILEVADVLVVNKADLPGSETTRRDLLAALALADGDEVPVLATIATGGDGVPELVDRLPLAPGGAPTVRRRAEAAVRLAAEQLLRGALDDRALLDEAVDAVVSGGLRVDDAARRWLGGAVQGGEDG
jgi:LAO/AO transport system kinase